VCRHVWKSFWFLPENNPQEQ